MKSEVSEAEEFSFYLCAMPFSSYINSALYIAPGNKINVLRAFKTDKMYSLK